jgi:hypothetical protein
MAQFTKPHNVKRLGIVRVMHFRVFIPALLARFPLQLSRVQSAPCFPMCGLFVCRFSVVVEAASFVCFLAAGIRLESFAIIFAVMLDPIITVSPHITLCAFLALVQMAVTHPWVFIEFAKFLYLATLETRLFNRAAH